MPKESFEGSIKKLEKIVSELEEGQIPLEQAIAKFEDGVKLSKWCTKKISEMEKKVSILMKDSENGVQEVDFSKS